jgi:hypothetical protein
MQSVLIPIPVAATPAACPFSGRLPSSTDGCPDAACGPEHMPRRTLLIEVSSADGRIVTRGRRTEFMLKAVIP